VKVEVNNWINYLQFIIASKTQEDKKKNIFFSVEIMDFLKKNLTSIILIVYAIENLSAFNPLKIDGKFLKNSKPDFNLRLEDWDAVKLALSINANYLKNYKYKSNNKNFLSDFNKKKKSIEITFIREKVIQKMFQILLDPSIDVLSDPNSYAFRKKRSCRQAVGNVANFFKPQGYSSCNIILKFSVKNFFNCSNQK